MAESNNVAFGTRTSWIELYKEQANAIEGMNSAYNSSEQVLDTFVGDMSAQLLNTAELLRQEPPPPTGNIMEDIAAFDAFADKQLAEVQKRQDDLTNLRIGATVEQLDQGNAFATAENHYNTARSALGARTLALGRQFTGEAPLYIARAIGPGYPKPLEESWISVRGAIEAYRFVMGVKRPNVTLGKPPKPTWAAEAHSHIVDDVQHVQLLQIALLPDPLAAAAAFNRESTLLEVGPPPPPTNENLVWRGGTWLETALEHIRSIEPADGGLLIDRLA